MANLYVLQFNISKSDAARAVYARLLAADCHDFAEDYEDRGLQEKADIYWNETEINLQKHFEILETARRID